MAVQFHVAHSSLVNGVGVVAAGPYYCAENSLRHALGRCMKGDEPIAVGRTGRGHERTRAGRPHRPDREPGQRPRVDLPRRGRSGRGQAGGRCTAGVLRTAGGSRAACSARNLPAAGHTFPAAAENLQDCGKTDTPFVGSCGIDGARQMLEHLYGPFGAPGRRRQAGHAGAILAVVVREGGRRRRARRARVALRASGLLGQRRCRALSPARRFSRLQAGRFVRERCVRAAGRLPGRCRRGRIVVLFPQVEPSFQPLNPNGCWDWWGYGGDGVRDPGRAADRGREGDGRRPDGCGRPARAGP